MAETAGHKYRGRFHCNQRPRYVRPAALAIKSSTQAFVSTILEQKRLLVVYLQGGRCHCPLLILRAAFSSLVNDTLQLRKASDWGKKNGDEFI